MTLFAIERRTAMDALRRDMAGAVHHATGAVVEFTPTPEGWCVSGADADVRLARNVVGLVPALTFDRSETDPDLPGERFDYWSDRSEVVPEKSDRAP